MSKHRHLISKYHWKSTKNLIELFVESVFSFFMYRIKNKKEELAKSFQNMKFPNLNFISVQQEASKSTEIHKANY